MNKKVKTVPQFESEAAERAFWEAHDSAELLDWLKAERMQGHHQAIARIIERRKNAPEMTEQEIRTAREKDRP